MRACGCPKTNGRYKRSIGLPQHERSVDAPQTEAAIGVAILKQMLSTALSSLPSQHGGYCLKTPSKAGSRHKGDPRTGATQ